VLTTKVNFTFDRQLRKAFPHHLQRTSDGDTPVIDQPIRMVSIDTPEKAHYAGTAETAQPKLDRTRRLLDGTYSKIPKGSRDYLVAKLTPDAAARHIAAGGRATEIFDRLLADRLTRPTGTVRPLATIATGEIIDRYGRLLGYLAPWFSGPPAIQYPKGLAGAVALSTSTWPHLVGPLPFSSIRPCLRMTI
jgi:hypothetical protein